MPERAGPGWRPAHRLINPSSERERHRGVDVDLVGQYRADLTQRFGTLLRGKLEVGRDGGQSSHEFLGRCRSDARQVALFDVGEAVGGGHFLDRPRMYLDRVVSQKHALLDLLDRREQVGVLELGRSAEQHEHAAGDEQLDGPGPSGNRAGPVPGRRRVHQVEAGFDAELLEGGYDRPHRQPTRRPVQDVRHIGVGFKRGDLDATRCEQPGRFSRSSADLERRAHRPSGVAQHNVHELVGIVQPIALIALRDRPKQQTADGLPRRLADHGLMNITASAIAGEAPVRLVHG